MPFRCLYQYLTAIITIPTDHSNAHSSPMYSVGVKYVSQIKLTSNSWWALEQELNNLSMLVISLQPSPPHIVTMCLTLGLVLGFSFEILDGELGSYFPPIAQFMISYFITLDLPLLRYSSIAWAQVQLWRSKNSYLALWRDGESGNLRMPLLHSLDRLIETSPQQGILLNSFITLEVSSFEISRQQALNTKMRVLSTALISISASRFHTFSNIFLSFQASRLPEYPLTIRCQSSTSSSNFSSFLIEPMTLRISMLASYPLMVLVYSGNSLMMPFISLKLVVLEGCSLLNLATSLLAMQQVKSSLILLNTQQTCMFLYFIQMGSSVLMVLGEIFVDMIFICGDLSVMLNKSMSSGRQQQLRTSGLNISNSLSATNITSSLQHCASLAGSSRSFKHFFIYFLSYQATILLKGRSNSITFILVTAGSIQKLAKIVSHSFLACLLAILCSVCSTLGRSVICLAYT